MTIDKDCGDPEANSQEQAQYSVCSSDVEESGHDDVPSQHSVRFALIQFRKVFRYCEDTRLAIEVDSVGGVGGQLDLA